MSPGLLALMTGLSFAQRGSNLAGLFAGGGVPAGAFETPSGQLTTSAPEILRDLQFPGGDVSPVGQALSTQMGTEGGFLGDLGGQIGGLFGQAAPYAGPVLNLVEGILNRDPVGITGAGLGGVAAAGESTALGGELAGMLGATGPGWAGPALSAASLIANIIRDEISDPHGRRSMAENVNWQESQQVPGDVRALLASGEILPFVSNPANLNGMSTEQLMQLYATAAGGIRAGGNLADPLAQSGRTDTGVTHPSFPGLSEQIHQTTPESILATLRIADALAERGVDPNAVTVGASGDPTGAYGLEWLRNLSGGFGESFANLQNQPIWLDPPALLAQTGLLPEQNIGYSAGYPFTGPMPDQGYLFSPGVMAQLAAIQPGGYEAGLHAMLQGLPGYAASPYASLWGAGPMEAQAGAGADAAGGGDTLSSPFGPGTVFPFESA